MNKVTYKANHMKDQSRIRIYRGDYLKTYTGIFKVVGQRNFSDGRAPIIEAVRLDAKLNSTGFICLITILTGECIAKKDWSDYVASGKHLTPYELPYNTVEDNE